MKDRARELIEGRLAGAVRYELAFAHVAGGATPGLFLSQAWYWTLRTTDNEGWFYKTTGEWTEETGLTRSELETARQRLQALEILVTERRGDKGRLHYKINARRLYELLPVCGKPANSPVQFAGNLKTDMPKTCKQAVPVCGNPESQFAGNLQTLPITKTTVIEDSFLPPANPRASRLKENWVLPDDWRGDATGIRQDLDVDYEAAKFKDFWLSKAGKDATKANWRATWRNWVRNAKPTQTRGASPVHRNGTHSAEITLEDQYAIEAEAVARLRL